MKTVKAMQRDDNVYLLGDDETRGLVHVSYTIDWVSNLPDSARFLACDGRSLHAGTHLATDYIVTCVVCWATLARWPS